MTDHQEHFGKKFYQDKKTGYWISTTMPKVRAHVWVWNHYHGKVPKGMHIHHKDGDKSNNTFDNLNIMHEAERLALHCHERMKDPKIKQKTKENCDKIRHMTKAWHASPEGKAWHKLHAIRCNFGNGPLIDYKCQYCTKDYQSKLKGKGATRFCSNACKSAWRRKEKLDDVDAICQKCGQIFRKNKYSKTKSCCSKTNKATRK